jgi:hypothetical protein
MANKKCIMPLYFNKIETQKKRQKDTKDISTGGKGDSWISLL